MALLYSVYGLHLHSNRAMPGLIPSGAAPSEGVHLWLDSRPDWLDDLPAMAQQVWYHSPYQDAVAQPTLTIWKLSGGGFFRFRYDDNTEFFLDSAGSRIWATWPAAATLEDTMTYLLGPVLGFVLRLRGVTPLHASAVAMGDQAVALLGPAGAGKSTTAAAFAKLGDFVLSDDVVPLREAKGSFLVLSGYPRLCLWPDSVRRLCGSPGALPLLTPNWDKRYLALDDNGCRFHPEPLPLAAIYVLGERVSQPTEPTVEAISGHSRLMALVSNTYMGYLPEETWRTRDFELLARVAAKVPMRQVHAREHAAHLTELCEIIRDDFQALIASTLAATSAKRP